MSEPGIALVALLMAGIAMTLSLVRTSMLFELDAKIEILRTTVQKLQDQSRVPYGAFPSLMTRKDQPHERN